ncbi:MAG: hypothetical protein OHK006_04360 [Thermodesulfovibrionales bacterium]
MQPFFLKSLLSLALLVLSGIAVYTMFEVFGRQAKRFSADALKRIHRLNGFLYIALFLAVSWLCVGYIAATRAELSSRASLHVVLGISIVMLICLKVLFVRFYRKYYAYAQAVGVLIAVLTFVTTGISAGYYLTVSRFGTHSITSPVSEKIAETAAAAPGAGVRTDGQSIARGKALYESKCYFCHDAYSTAQGTGPGHKGILKNPVLPVSGKPATPENVLNQLRTPFKDMPSFSYLTDDEAQDILAFLNTL